MATPLSRLALRVAYGARQLPRMAWYGGHSLALRQLAQEARRCEGLAPRKASTERAVPERASLYADMAELLRADLSNVERALYPLPADRDGPPLAMLRRSVEF